MANTKTAYRYKSVKGPALTSDIFAKRRKEFLRKLPAGSVAIIVTNPEQTRSNDTEFQYRASSDVVYLSNFVEPECALVFVKPKGNKPGQFLMFVRAKDRTREIWTGVRHGPEGAVDNFGADEAHNIEDFDKVVVRFWRRPTRSTTSSAATSHFDKKFRALWEDPEADLLNPESIIHEMRLFKSAEEIAMMRHAGKISASAHCEAMRIVRPGMMEYQLQASMEAVFKFNGASYPAYTSIVGGGNNAVILHYVENNCELKDGDLILIDAACEYHGYASDITRTFPVNGKFSKAQREIYEMVLAAEKAGIAMARPWCEAARRARSRLATSLRAGLVKLGILPKSTSPLPTAKRKCSTPGRKAEAAARVPSRKGPITLFDFFMHGTSHFIGLDVHDVGTGGTRARAARSAAQAGHGLHRRAGHLHHGR
jgi:Xaa-Pro aminopeptidase